MFSELSIGRTGLAALILLGGAASGCRMMSSDEVEAVRRSHSSAFDASGYVAENWRSRILVSLEDRAIDARTARDGAPVPTGSYDCLRTSEDSDCNVAVSGEGTVKAVDRQTPVGRLTIATAAGDVILQIGPLVTGTSLRDSLPFIRFGDVPDQIAFAQLGEAINAAAMHATASTTETLRPGTHIRYLGAATISKSGVLVVTPVRVTLEKGAA